MQYIKQHLKPGVIAQRYKDQCSSERRLTTYQFESKFKAETCMNLLDLLYILGVQSAIDYGNGCIDFDQILQFVSRFTDRTHRLNSLVPSPQTLSLHQLELLQGVHELAADLRDIHPGKL
jgi:hypothetical protein